MAIRAASLNAIIPAMTEKSCPLCTNAIPNAETIEAMLDVQTENGIVEYADLEKLKKSLDDY